MNSSFNEFLKNFYYWQIKKLQINKSNFIKIGRFKFEIKKMPKLNIFTRSSYMERSFLSKCKTARQIFEKKKKIRDLIEI